MRENLILYNPASELELPKPEKRLPKHTLTAEEAELILTQPDIETDQGIRDRAILEVLYSTGIRRQEVLNLTKQDVNAGGGVLAVRQKVKASKTALCRWAKEPCCGYNNTLMKCAHNTPYRPALITCSYV